MELTLPYAGKSLLYLAILALILSDPRFISVDFDAQLILPKVQLPSKDPRQLPISYLHCRLPICEHFQNGFVRRCFLLFKPSLTTLLNPQWNTTSPHHPKTALPSHLVARISPPSSPPSSTSTLAMSPMPMRNQYPATSPLLSGHWLKRSKACRCIEVGRGH